MLAFVGYQARSRTMDTATVDMIYRDASDPA
jgi:hypothetical protein